MYIYIYIYKIYISILGILLYLELHSCTRDAGSLGTTSELPKTRDVFRTPTFPGIRDPLASMH